MLRFVARANILSSSHLPLSVDSIVAPNGDAHDAWTSRPGRETRTTRAVVAGGRAGARGESRSWLTAAAGSARNFSPRYKHGRPRAFAHTAAYLSQSQRGVVEPLRECETASRKGTDNSYFFSGLLMKTALHRSSGGRDLKIDRDFGDCFD